PLAGLSEIVLPLNAWPERSVAATKSYIAALAGVLQLVRHWTGDAALDRALQRLPADLGDALGRDWSAALPIMQAAHSLYVVARGPGFGAAFEAAIKLKETCGLHAEAQSAAELMHGPMALAAPDFPVMLFSQRDAALPGLAGLADTLTGRGVPVL